MKALKKIAALLLAVLMLAALGACSNNSEEKDGREDTATPAPANEGDSDTVVDPTNEERETTAEFAIVNAGGSVSKSGSVYTITAAGEYSVKGRLDDGQIVIRAGSDDEVKLIFENVSISCSTAAPILVVSAGEVKIKAEEGTYNAVHDERASIEDDEEYNAAIWSDCDLDLVGKGTLIVTSASAGGVKTKDDLSVKNVTAKITCEGVALRGNDSVTVESGELILVSNGGDGVKTSNSDVSKKGNQKGTVLLSGGRIDVYAAKDGISAAYNVEINSDKCTVNVYTADYAVQGGAEETSGELYLAVPAQIYSEAYDYYFFFYNDDSNGVWVKAEYETKIYSGRSASHYGLKAAVPAGYTNLIVNIVEKGTEPDGSNYLAASEGETINTAMNCCVINSVSGDGISCDWAKLTSSNGDKTTYSSKGIKAGNDIIISGGVVTVKSMDDALHANEGEKLDSGAESTGNITISGGSLYIECADDGIHADANVTISGGSINIKESHEGIEANVITINEGVLYINAQDDAMNAGKGTSTPLISINGGYVDVTTPSGDTDGVDSNGNFEMTGGFAVIRCGAAMGGMAGSIDVDGKITVTGGTVVAVGGVCETPESGSVCTYISGETSLGSGSYTVTDASGNVIISFEVSSNYSSFWIASDKLVKDGSYSLRSGETELVSWSQSSETVGSAGNGGMHGPGGRH